MFQKGNKFGLYSYKNREIINKNKICKVDFCKKEAKCRGFCSMHYARFHSTGDPLKTPTGRVHGKRSICIIKGCTSIVEGHDYCKKHYKRWKRYGDPNVVKQKHNGWHLNSEGYVIWFRPNHKWARRDGTVLAHRFIMQEKLGRKLNKNELVHHRNGNRQDNREENLEIKTIKEHYSGSDLCVCPKCGYEF